MYIINVIHLLKNSFLTLLRTHLNVINLKTKQIHCSLMYVIIYSKTVMNRKYLGP